MSSFTFICAGCGVPCPSDQHPFGCPNRGDGDIDHLLEKQVELQAGWWPEIGEDNPFLRYRRLFYSHYRAESDAGFCQRVRELDAAIGRLEERDFGFRQTDYAVQPKLAAALGFESDAIWVKNETSNVSGSHKARHLMGIMLYLLGDETLASERRPLAIASCGNAALAAAVVAKAADWPLSVYVPQSANKRVLDKLEQLDATVVRCSRQAGQLGDPCYLGFQQALADGAIPFCCTGPDNGLTIEGGETLGYELIDHWRRGVPDHLIIQIGGGALASGIIQAIRRAVKLGVIGRSPRIHPLQTENVHPLNAAFDAIWNEIDTTGVSLESLVQKRSLWMNPWTDEPHSIAHGILDDETYDAWQIILGTLASGGWPLLAGEDTLAQANRLAHETTGIPVCHTGSSGLAGLIEMKNSGQIEADETVTLLFTGVER